MPSSAMICLNQSATAPSASIIGNTVHYSTVQHTTILQLCIDTVQYSIQYSTVHSTVQYTVQYSTQYSTVQYNIAQNSVNCCTTVYEKKIALDLTFILWIHDVIPWKGNHQVLYAVLAEVLVCHTLQVIHTLAATGH